MPNTMQTQWFVYLICCQDNTLYCGVTTDPVRRLAQHNGLLPGGAKYTKARRPVHMVCLMAFPDKKTAFSVEYRVKKSPKYKKINLLQSLGASQTVQ